MYIERCIERERKRDYLYIYIYIYIYTHTHTYNLVYIYIYIYYTHLQGEHHAGHERAAGPLVAGSSNNINNNYD